MFQSGTYELIEANGLSDTAALGKLDAFYAQGHCVGYLVDMSRSNQHADALEGETIEFLDNIVETDRLRVAFFQCHDPHIIHAVTLYWFKGFKILLTNDAREALDWCRGEIR